MNASEQKACGVCHDVINPDEDYFERCAGCRCLFCDDCGDWCHAEYDVPNGDYFCANCQIEPDATEKD